MAVDYQPFPIITDPDELLQLGYDEMAAQVPGWEPYEGQPEARMLGAVAFMAAVVADLAVDTPPALFRQFGTKLVGIPSEDAAPASVNSTWTMKDDAGYTIAAGTAVGIPAGGDRLVAFNVAGDVVVPDGVTATDVGEILLVAAEPGADGSGLGGVGVVVEAIDAYRYVATDGIVLTGVTTGGVDGETDEAYQDRLADRLRLLADRPILARDHADLVQDAIAEIDRAVAIDNYIPAGPGGTPAAQTDAERAVAVAAIDAQGLAVSSGVKTAAQEYLEARREQNFVVSIIDPTYTTIDVAFTAVSMEGYEPSEVEGRAEQAVIDSLSPAYWGLSRRGGRRRWTNKTVVRYGEVWSEIDRVDGIDYLTALTIGAARAVAVVAATDVFTSTAHGLADGTEVHFSGLTGGAPLVAGTTYFVRDSTANTFKVAATLGGAAIDVTSDGSGSVSPAGVANVTLAGVAPLPEPGAVAGTVT